MLIYQILSKFPLEVIVKLEDTKLCEEEWTMELLRKFLTQFITIQENAQRRVVNAKGRVYSDTRQLRQEEVHYQNREVNKGERQIVNQVPVETFATNVKKGNHNGNSCVFCKGEHFNDECEKFRSLVERIRSRSK